MYASENTLELREQAEQRFAHATLAKSIVKELNSAYGVQYSYDLDEDNSLVVSLNPGPVVGVARLTDGTVVRFTPKVPVANVFAMWDIAQGNSMKLDWSRYADVDSVDGMYDTLARQFILRIRERSVRGLHRTYEERHGRPAALRGRINVAESIRRPWQPELACRYDEHEADNLLNRLLLWALYSVIRSAALLRNDTRTMAAAVFRTLAGRVSLVEYRPSDYRDIDYTRLTQPYEPLHAMARFFVEHTAPELPGEARRRAVPFRLLMPELFEGFVAEWLRLNAPPDTSVRTQQSVKLEHSVMHNRPVYTLSADIVLRAAGPDPRPFAVLDTKYKAGGKPDESDINQVHTYATQLGVTDAWLVYPEPLAEPLDITMQTAVRIRSATFDIGQDLETAGRRFLVGIGVGE